MKRMSKVPAREVGKEPALSVPHRPARSLDRVRKIGCARRLDAAGIHEEGSEKKPWPGRLDGAETPRPGVSASGTIVAVAVEREGRDVHAERLNVPRCWRQRDVADMSTQ